MTITRVQTLRSATAGSRPAAGTRQPGELYVNWADNAFGVISATQTPFDLIAVRFFSSSASYNAGDFVLETGQLYTAEAAITPGAFNATQWNKVTLAGDLGTMASQNANAVAITGGAVNGTTVGATTAAAGTFSTMTTASAHITGGTIDGAAIGGATAAAGHFTTLGATGTGTFSGTAPQINIVPSTASDAMLQIIKASSGTNNVINAYTGIHARWQLVLGDSTSEAGSDAGSNFGIYAVNDAGTSRQAIVVTRANLTTTMLGNTVCNTFLSVGTGNTSGLVTLVYNGASLSQGAININNTDAGTAGQNVQTFYRNNASVGSIQASNVNTAYQTTSDRRIKTDFRPIEDATGQLGRLKVYDHAWVVDPGQRALGVIAQEAIKIVPQAVGATDDGVTGKVGDEGFMPWGVDYSQFVPLLIAALQEANRRIAALEARQSGAP